MGWGQEKGVKMEAAEQQNLWALTFCLKMKAELDDFSIDVIKAAFKATLLELLVALQYCKQLLEGELSEWKSKKVRSIFSSGEYWSQWETIYALKGHQLLLFPGLQSHI